MASTKTKNAPPVIAPWLRHSAAYLTGPGRVISLSMAMIAIFLGGWFFAWREVRSHVLNEKDYRVGPHDVEISPLPEWIHTDIRAEVFRNASLDKPLSILDDNLTERIRNAFSLHPWIAKVRQVTKRYPARVSVELDYRCPVLMVEMPGGLLPVDALGILLPSGDFSPVEKSRYPRLVGVETAPLGTIGDRWGDARVAAAAEIAEAVGPAWLELKLASIVPSAASSATDDYVYTLLAQNGSRIIWGRAPSSNVPGEPPAGDKIARLKLWAASQSTEKGRGGQQEFDLRIRL
jgi:hypothetical protein